MSLKFITPHVFGKSLTTVLFLDQVTKKGYVSIHTISSEYYFHFMDQLGEITGENKHPEDSHGCGAVDGVMKLGKAECIQRPWYQGTL